MAATGAVPPTVVARAPKALLHDHLDGGLRSETVVDLAAASGYGLPTTDAAELGRWFREAADSGSLVRYLETFSHTVAVMQTAEQLTRVARHPSGRLVGASTGKGASSRAVVSTGVQSTSVTLASFGRSVNSTVMITSGIKITASDLIMSAGVARALDRATNPSSQTPTNPPGRAI